MSFFDKINNYLIVNAIKEIGLLKGRDSGESLPDSVCLSWHIPNLRKRE